MDWTSITLAIITLLGGCGWAIDRKKHRHEIASLRADVKQKELDLSTDFVVKFRTLISDPLEAEVEKLRTEVKELRDAIQGIYDCPLRDDCPVRGRLRQHSSSEV
ncbi:MAG: hypothetical protein J5729_05415 [Bacteroidaceae bacterium]|nr:hypothetical protein [Bacteroidaceae bacterium]